MENQQIDNVKELLIKAKNISVLYAEDEKFLQDSTSKFFKKLFKSVDVASDGQEALDMYRDNKYDIVITDILMPNMDGLELIRNIRNINEKQEIIINSAYTETEFKEEANRYNITSYIRKPIQMNEIVKIISDYIDKSDSFLEKDDEQ